MTELIRQVRPVWAQVQQMELPLPPHALRNALLALGTGLLLMAGLASLSTFWAPTRAWWDAAEHGSAMAAGVQASLLAAVATAVGALPVFLVQRVSKLQEAALLSFSAGVMLAAAIFALLLPSLSAGQALFDGGRIGAAALSGVGLALARHLAAHWQARLVLLGRTALGRSFFAVGGNPHAAVYTGLDVGRTQAVAFVISGALAGLTGYLWVARYAVAYVDVAGGFELDVVAACVIGGISIAGGVGTVTGVFLGCIFLGIIKNALHWLRTPRSMADEPAHIFSQVARR